MKQPSGASRQALSQAQNILSLQRTWQGDLQERAADGSLAAAVARSLQLDGNNELLKTFIAQWASGDFRNFPKLISLSSEEMKGALGAFAAGTNELFINREWLKVASDDDVFEVLNEEFGHFLDAALKPIDTDGDEGEIFAKLLSTQPLSAEEEQELRLQVDHGILESRNHVTPVEFAATSTGEYPLKYFLRIDGIAGPCTVTGFEGCFELTSHNLDATAPAGSLPQFTDLSVVLRPGASLASFYQRLAAGQLINSLQIIGQTTLADGRSFNTYELRYGASVVSSVDDSRTTNSNQPVNLSFRSNTFGVSTTPLSASGVLGSTASFARSGSTTTTFSSLAVPTSLAAAADVSGTSNTRYFLRIDGIAGPCTVTGFEGCFELSSHNLDATAPAGSLPQFTDLSVVLRPGASLASFYQRLAAGQLINNLQIIGQTTLADGRNFNTYELRYGASVVSSVDDSRTNNSNQPVNLSFRSNTFGVSTTPLSASGVLGSTTSFARAGSTTTTFSSLTVPTSLAAAADVSGTSNTRYFLRIDGIAGPCTVTGFEGCFELTSHNLDATAPAGSLPQFTDLSVVLRPGASLASFYQRLAAGQLINNLQIIGQTTLADGRSFNTYELRYGASVVSSVDDSRTTNSNQPVNLSFQSNTFGVSTTPLSASGVLGSTTSFARSGSTTTTFSSLAVPTSLAAAADVSGTSNTRYFLRIDGIAGPCTVARFEGCFELTSHNLDATAPAGSRPQFTDLSVVLRPGASLASFYQRIAAGQLINSLQIIGQTTLADGTSFNTYELRYGASVVSSVDDSRTTNSNQPVNLSFQSNTFGVSTTPLSASGVLGSTTSFARSGSTTTTFSSLAVPTSLAAAADVSGTSNTRYFLRIDGIAGPCTVARFEGCFELTSHNLDATAPAGSRPQFTDLSVVLRPGASLASFYQRIAAGQLINSLQIIGQTTLADGTSFNTYELRYGASVVSSIDDARNTNSTQPVNLSFRSNTFGVSTTQLSASGVLGSTTSFARSGLTSTTFSSLAVPTSLAAAADVSGTSNTRYFLRIDGIAGTSTVPGFEGFFEIISQNFDATISSTSSAGQMNGPTQFTDLSIILQPGASLASLYQRLINNSVSFNAQIIGATSAGDRTSVRSIYDLKASATLLSYVDANSSSGVAQNAELRFSLSKVGIRTRPLQSSGQTGTPVEFGFDLANGTSLAYSSFNFAPVLVSPPTPTGTSGISFISNEAGSAALYKSDNTSLFLISIPANQVVTLTLNAQTAITTATLRVNSSTGASTSLATNFLLGTTANDTLNGTTGVDAIYGFSGNDNLTGAAGTDSMNGGEGSDIYLIASTTDHAAAEILDTGTSGSDELRFTASTANQSINIFAGDTGLEKVVIGTGTASTAVTTATTALSINAAAAPNALTLIGNDGANTLIGTNFADTLNGNSGNDQISGGIGNDLLNGGVGTDTMNGGEGNDIYLISSSADHTAAEVADNGLIGTDELRFSSITASQTISVFANDTGLERVVIGTGEAAAADTTATLALSINATAAPNGLVLTGNDGANTISGSGFADTLNGNKGNDSLNGAKGNDVLSGGLGADVFRFDSALDATSNVDVITDFTISDSDKIELENSGTGPFTTITATGTLAVTAFVVDTIFTTSAQRIRYEPGSGNLLYDADGSGSTSKEILFAKLASGLAMTNLQFVVT